jgi:hypothetical protein
MNSFFSILLLLGAAHGGSAPISPDHATADDVDIVYASSTTTAAAAPHDTRLPDNSTKTFHTGQLQLIKVHTLSGNTTRTADRAFLLYDVANSTAAMMVPIVFDVGATLPPIRLRDGDYVTVYAHTRGQRLYARGWRDVFGSGDVVGQQAQRPPRSMKALWINIKNCGGGADVNVLRQQMNKLRDIFSQPVLVGCEGIEDRGGAAALRAGLWAENGRAAAKRPARHRSQRYQSKRLLLPRVLLAHLGVRGVLGRPKPDLQFQVCPVPVGGCATL